MRKRRVVMTLAMSLIGLSGWVLKADSPRASADGAFSGKSVLYRAASTGKAGIFVSAIYVSQLTDTFRGEGPFTVFVPTDQAFAKLPRDVLASLLRPEGEKKLARILSYHVIRSKILSDEITSNPRPRTLAGPCLTIAANQHGVAVNEATLVETDLVGRNGVVHLIDRVLMPPDEDLLGVAEKAGNFKVLLKAIVAAGLDGALAAEGPFTVLAPTDEAFVQLGDKAIVGLLKDKKKLTQILKYHVIPGKLTARDLLSRKTQPTLLESEVRPDIKAGRLVINRSNVIASDIEASNGIIHVIDAVLIPGND